MRTSIKLLASALLLTLTVSVSSPGMAGDDKIQAKVFTAVVFPAANTSKLWMCLEKYQSAPKITLSLVDAKGEVLFQETVSGRNTKKKAYRQQFDMSQLADGLYTFRVVAGTQVEEHKVTLSTPVPETTQPTRLIAIK